MPKKLSLKEVQNKINKTCSNVIVISKISSGKYEFEDKEFGRFSGYLNHLINGKLTHERRKKNLKGASLNERNLRLKEKIPYLKLLKYNSSSKSFFYDEEFGKFCANFKDVYAGKVNHKKRSCFNLKKSKTESVLNKTKSTNLKRYGVENPLQNEEIKEKLKKTNLERYGVENVSQNKKIQNKRIKTNFNRFNCENVFQNDHIKKEIKQTNLDRYGVENIIHLKEIKEKIKKTNIEKYGFKSPAQNKNIKKKIRKTNLENGNWHNIRGCSLLEYYKNSELINTRSYSYIQQCYLKYGEIALSLEYYRKLSGKSKIANIWLDQVEKKLTYNLIREYSIPNTRCHADGYDPKTNTIYEFYGDYWHGYPFKNLSINEIVGLSFNTLYYQTIARKEKILSMGYKVIDIWESDFNL